jgi:aspartyl-tRNA(Asn)/glutamyl-tRNA(Gln) amidotransferase subunit A
LRPPRLDGVRLGRLTGYFEAVLEPAVRSQYEAAVERLASAGVRITDVAIPHAADLAAIYLHVVLPEAAAWHAVTLDRAPERYTPGVRMRLELGRYILAEDYLRARAAMQVVRGEVDGALDGVDALLLPTLAITAPAIGAETVDIEGRPEPVRAALLRLTQPFNLSGHPAIALPAGLGGGLPVSVQIVGRHARTWTLLDLAAGLAPIVAGS